MSEKNWQLKCATQQDVSGLIHRLRLTLAKKDEEMKMLVTITKKLVLQLFFKAGSGTNLFSSK
jgi:hypothetical protein